MLTYSERFAALKVSERRLIFLCLIVVTGWLSYLYIIEPVLQNIQTLNEQIPRQQQQVQELSTNNTLIQAQLNADFDKDVNEAIQRLEARKQQQTDQVEAKKELFISAAEMVSLLQALLQRDDLAKLMSLSTLKPRPLELDNQGRPLIFEHKIKVQMTGTFAQLVATLRHIEDIPWRLAWESIHFQVGEYPLANMTIELITVSDHEDFIILGLN